MYPLQNYIGWGLVVFGIIQIFRLWPRNPGESKAEAIIIPLLLFSLAKYVLNIPPNTWRVIQGIGIFLLVSLIVSRLSPASLSWSEKDEIMDFIRRH